MSKVIALKSTILLGVLCSAWLGLAATPFPDYPAKPAKDYQFKAERHGVIVAVEPLEETETQKQYFRANLRTQGFLPVLVIIENASADGEYTFDSSAVGLADGAEVAGKGAAKTASLKTSGGIIDLTLLKGGSMRDVNVRENLTKRHIRSTTLGAGAAIHGFVYIPVATDGARSEIHLQVPLTDAKSGEIEVFDLKF